MNEELVNGHIERVEEGARNVYHLHNLSKYVSKYLRIDGAPYTFGDKYGFQATVINDTSRVTNTVKPAQIGLTTANMAYILAGCASQKKFNCIYSLPTSNDAQKLVTTKLDPIITGSPEIKRLLNYNVNNNELKQIGDNFLYIRGSKSETAALSISADCLVADEIDRSDPDTLKQFRSRLQASELKIIKQFSTPTIEGVGISKEAESSRRYRHFATCYHCGHMWLPTYHNDIIIPGYKGDLKEITKTTIKDVMWRDAHWNCPNCQRDPKLHPSRLEWVCENPIENYEANTYYITPVTTCLVLLPAYLVNSSTEFNTRSEWANQVLGETSEEENEQITLGDINSAEVDYSLDSSEMHYLGADMGLMCAVSIGRMTADGVMLVVHRELVPIGNFEKRRLELIRQFKVICSVHDTQPYLTEIMRITDSDQNAYGAMFSNAKNAELFTIREKEEDLEEGKLNLRQININRTAALDSIRDMLKAKLILMCKNDKSETYKEQYISLKRIQTYVRDELVYQWVKTNGNDHMLFSMMYLLMAIKLRGRVTGWMAAGSVPFITKYLVKGNLSSVSAPVSLPNNRR